MSLAFKYFKQNFKEQKFLVLVTIFLTLILAVFELVLPFFFKRFIDIAERMSQFHLQFVIYLLLYCGCLVFNNLLNVLWYVILDLISGKLLYNLRSKLFASILNMPSDIVNKTGYEKLKNVLFSDVMNIYANITMFGMKIISNVLMLIIFLTATFILNKLLGILFFIMSGIGFAISMLSRKKIKECSKKVNTELKNTNSFTNSFVDAIDLLKTNDLDEYIEIKHKKTISSFTKVILKNDFFQVFLKNLLTHINLIFSLLSTCVLILLNKNTSTGNVLFLFFIANMIFSFSTTLEQLISSFYSALPSFEHVDNVIGYYNKDNAKRTNMYERLKSLSIENVSVKFTNDSMPILQNINLNFLPGQRIKIVGHNGTGKSTFMKLVTSVLQPNTGNIFINEINLQTFNKQFLKKRILYVSQNEYIINEKISDYAKYMGIDLTGVNLNDFLNTWSFHENKDAQLLEIKLENNAVNISGGQKKKLLALKLFSKCKDADIILIDEIEAGLDANSITRYKETRHDIFKNDSTKIVFEITHSQADDDFFSHILHFENGKATITANYITPAPTLHQEQALLQVKP